MGVCTKVIELRFDERSEPKIDMTSRGLLNRLIIGRIQAISRSIDIGGVGINHVLLLVEALH